MDDQLPVLGRAQVVDVAHEVQRLRLCLLRLRQVKVHLVAVEVGIERPAAALVEAQRAVQPYLGSTTSEKGRISGPAARLERCRQHGQQASDGPQQHWLKCSVQYSRTWAVQGAGEGSERGQGKRTRSGEMEKGSDEGVESLSSTP